MKINIIVFMMYLIRNCVSMKTKVKTKVRVRTQQKSKIKAKLKTQSRQRMKTKNKSKSRMKEEYRQDEKKAEDKPKEEGGGEEDQGFWVYRGWLKFYEEKSEDFPTKFLINTAFEYQMYENPKTNLKEKDDFGYLNIPDNVHFYGMMNDQTLYLVQARRNDLAKTYLSIEFSWLKEIVLPKGGDEKISGGLVDMGVFKEGSCFKLVTQDDLEYTFCADDLSEQQEWIEKIKSFCRISMKSSFSSQSQFSAQVTTMGVPDGFEFNLKSEKKKTKIKDGKWVILKSWSGCTLACGGGKSYLQRMCVPPENGGKPCEGEPILEKDCNIQDCPPADRSLEPKVKLLDPIVKTMQVSDRRQRYQICVIREGDLLMEIQHEQVKDVYLPVRVVLNNRTITAFSMPKYDNVVKSFDLGSLEFERVRDMEKDKKCFIMFDSRTTDKRITLCIMPENLRHGESMESAKVQWMKDITMFKEWCHHKYRFTELPPSEFVQEMSAEIKKDEQDYETSNEEVENQEKKNEKNNVIIEKESKKIESNIETEIKYERLKRDELMDLQELVQQQLKNQMDKQEGDVKGCEKKTNKMEDKNLLNKMESENENVKKMMDDAEKKTIIEARSEADWEMQKQKVIAQRKLKAQKERIFTIRQEMSLQVYQDNKRGDKSHCEPTKPEPERTKFCEERYSNRPYIQMDCKKDERQFCFACCEYQFGEMQVNDREDCYKAVCLGWREDDPNPQMPDKKQDSQWIEMTPNKKISRRLSRLSVSI